MPYQPIENYGVIGDMRTVALVGMNGSIDWFCYPHFDSPSVFAAILDDKKGGRFRIAPEFKIHTLKQLYWPETNVLVTRFLSAEGVGEVVDFMPVGKGIDGKPYGQLVLRHVRAVRGSMCFHLDCEPAFNYARDKHQTEITGTGAVFRSDALSLGLTTAIPLKPTENGVTAIFALEEGCSAIFVLKAVAQDARGGGGITSEKEASRLSRRP